MRGYDYSAAGAYFVTLCTQDRACLFGDIVDGVMVLNEAGRMVQGWYGELENKFPLIQNDAFVCMPNHVHFIVINRGEAPSMTQRAGVGVPAIGGQGGHAGPPLHGVVQWFKTMTTNDYIRGVKQRDWPPFAGKLWQRNYWEHIIRNESQAEQIRDYISGNPARWPSDRLNPSNPL